MTDNKTIKGLECCFSNDCEHCDYEIREDTKTLQCNDNLMKDALDLINRQRAEIDRLNDDYLLLDVGVEAVRAEAVKEFAERVKLEFYYEFEELIPSIMADKIDNILKEMIGDNSSVDNKN